MYFGRGRTGRRGLGTQHGYTEDREFVVATYKALLDSPMKSFTELGPVKDSSGADLAMFAENLA